MFCEFEPSICKVTPATPATDDQPGTPEIPAKFRGKIKIKPLSYDDRYELIEKQALAMAEVADDDKEKKGLALMRFAMKFSRETLPGFFISSTLTRIEDGFEFDSLEKIKMDGPASTLIPELTSAIISGELSLGK